MDETRPLTLRFTPTARSDIARILGYIRDHSPQGRANVEARLLTEFALLQGFPVAGTSTTRAGLRRRVVPNYPYVIFYQIKGQSLVIVAVRHTSRAPRLP